MKSAGLHHVTAICADAQENYDFYTGVLGLRLVKRTVNFDDPGSYHLYYGDQSGAPGTILTFFAWPHAGMGRPSIGETLAVALSVPVGSLDAWETRLQAVSIEVERAERFGEQLLTLHDPDGMSLELIESDDLRADTGDVAASKDEAVASGHAVRGLHSVTLRSIDFPRTSEVLNVLGAQLQAKTPEPDSELARFAFGNGAPGALCDLLPMGKFTRGQIGAGTIHHVAFRAQNDAEQEAWRELLTQTHNFNVSPVMERSYFRSIYFREPGGVLFEIATDTPGFAVDESLDTLGRDLKLPPQYEATRAQIEATLPPLQTEASD